MTANTETSDNALILIVEDIPSIRDMLLNILESRGYEVLQASTGKAGVTVAGQYRPDLVFVDTLLPNGVDGFETCRRLKSQKSMQNIPIIFISDKREADNLGKGFRAGAVDYVVKPISREEILAKTATHLKITQLRTALKQKTAELQREINYREALERACKETDKALDLADRGLSMLAGNLVARRDREAVAPGIHNIVGRSPGVTRILKEIRLVQEWDKTSVLVGGESGTGKELIAREIHFGGTRKNGPFVPVNCAAIPLELAESFFFGHIRGSFTGAIGNRKGYFTLADKGTLFLDEVGEMSRELQMKLLRVLEDGRITPVGAVTEKKVDVRMISATNTDLRTKIDNGLFRKDLYYRLSGFSIRVPPLRERPEDISLLARHFLRLFSAELTLEHDAILSQEAQAMLQFYSFPGNVRELKNIIESALIRSRGSIVEADHLVFDGPNVIAEEDVDSTIRDADGLWQRKFESIPKSIKASEENAILAHLSCRGSINNHDCREFLNINRRRATYLLEKMHKAGLILREGSRRWTRYHLP